jgi:Leucine-rich repeat (LRR) protein
LKYLDLSHNFLKFIKKDMLTNFNKLILLGLSNNLITHIEQDSFADLMILHDLYLNGNDELAWVDNVTLARLKSLKNFYISSNLITTFVSLETIKESFQKANTSRVIDEVSYLNSLFVTSFGNSSFVDRDCFNTLYLIKNNIQLNLKTDTDVFKFLEECRCTINEYFSNFMV